MSSNRLQASVHFDEATQTRLVPGKVAVRYNPPAIGLEYTLYTPQPTFTNQQLKSRKQGEQLQSRSPPRNVLSNCSSSNLKVKSDKHSSDRYLTSSKGIYNNDDNDARKDESITSSFTDAQQVLIVPLPLNKSADPVKVAQRLMRGDFGRASYLAAVPIDQLQRVIAVLLRNLT